MIHIVHEGIGQCIEHRMNAERCNKRRYRYCFCLREDIHDTASSEAYGTKMARTEGIQFELMKIVYVDVSGVWQ